MYNWYNFVKKDRTTIHLISFSSTKLVYFDSREFILFENEFKLSAIFHDHWW